MNQEFDKEKYLRKVKRQKRHIRIGTLFALLAISVVMIFINPVRTPWFPQCIFRKVTGFSCPGCGSGRGMHSLVKGQVAEAWAYNPALLIGLFLVLLLLLAEWLALYSSFWRRINRFFQGKAFMYSLLIVVIAWWIGRNIIGI